MNFQRYRKSTFLLSAVFAAALVGASAEQARAGSRSGAAVGGAAAGLALGLIIGGAMSQGQQGAAPGTPTYRNCASIYGPGAVNSASNPGKCVCQAGYTWASEGGSRRCLPRGSATVSQGATRSVGGGAKHTAAELEKIQESLNLLGYDAGSVDGSLGPKTQQAILKFQGDKQFQQTGYLTPGEQQILFKDVQAKSNPPAPLPQQAQPERISPPGPDQERGVTKPDVRMELAHWETVRNSKNPAELEDYIARYPSGEFTKLAMLRLDQIKAADEEERKPKRNAEAAEPSKDASGAPLPVIDETAFPKAKQRRADAVAVIIGNSLYRNGVPVVEYGGRDADAMKLLAMRTLGLDSGNIIFKKDATRAEMDTIFGTDKDHKGSLWRMIDPEGQSDVYVFYSGHGVPGVNDTEGNFLLPVDGDPNHPSLNGYPLSQLYRNLGELKTRSTTVFLDACFSGQSPDAKSTTLIKQASPVFISKPTPSDSSKINVFAAAGERQLSNWDPDAGHGMFTNYVLTGLAGEADLDKNKEVTAKELQEYVSRQVRKAARRKHGREQEPWFKGNDTFVLSSF